MATLLASKVARVRRFVTDNADTLAKSIVSMTDKDYRALIHACEDSPRRAIRIIKEGPKDVAHFIKTWRDSAEEVAAAASLDASTPKPVPERDPAHGDKPKTTVARVNGKPAIVPVTTPAPLPQMPTSRARRAPRGAQTVAGAGLAAFAAAAQ